MPNPSPSPPEIGEGLRQHSAGGRERPILFSGPMVRAILDGRKTQTRRAIKGVDMRQAGGWLAAGLIPAFVADPANGLCPYGVPGDLLWVRESGEMLWNAVNHGAEQDDWEPAGWAHPDGQITGWNGIDPSSWIGDCRRQRRPSIHMPRWASRITLRITYVRVERLNEISEADAEAEGVQEPTLVPTLGAFWSSRDGFARLWNHINGPGSWDANPWVWALTFEVIEPGSQGAQRTLIAPQVEGESPREHHND